MKQLLIGNAAVARGLYEAGCGVVSSYPGTPSTEITETAAAYPEIYCEWAPNEKVAMEVAFGASLGGVRSACAMKHVGLNVAADPLFTMSYTGVRGGLVVCVADDPGMHSSQNEQDSRHYAIAAKVPMLEPADSAESLQFAKAAFDLSERFDTPVLLRMCTRIAHSQSIVELGERADVPKKPYEKDPAKYIMMPGYAKKRHPLVEERTAALAAFAEDCPFNRVEMGGTDMGIITSGASYQYVKEVFGDTVSVLKIGMVNPLPTALIRDFAAKVKRLVVIEELDGILETHCRNIGVAVEGKELFTNIGEFSQHSIAAVFGLPEKDHIAIDTPIPVRPPVMCAGCPHRGLYYTLAKHHITVIGDIGCYTLGAQQPLNAMDSTLCMGASVSGLHGFNKAQGAESEQKTVAVIGDSTFMHSGMTGLANVVYNKSFSTVLILDNSITGMTGHQQNPTTGLTLKEEPTYAIRMEDVARALGVKRVSIVDPADLAALEKTLREEIEAEEPSVVIVRRPCALLKCVKHKPPFKVETDKCKSCKMCMKLGCPAIKIENGKATIDTTLCVGCGLCKQMCKFDAICE